MLDYGVKLTLQSCQLFFWTRYQNSNKPLLNILSTKKSGLFHLTNQFTPHEVQVFGLDADRTEDEIRTTQIYLRSSIRDVCENCRLSRA